MTAEPVPLHPENAEPLDLTDIARRHPVRVVTFDMAVVINGLSTGDMTDLETALGIDFAALASAPRFDVLAALAWLVARREYPGLTLDEVRTGWRVELDENPTLPPPKSARRKGSSQSPG